MWALVRAVLKDLSHRFSCLYSHAGRPSIFPEALLNALLLQVHCGIWSERLLMEQLDCNASRVRAIRNDMRRIERHTAAKSGCHPWRVALRPEAAECGPHGRRGGQMRSSLNLRTTLFNFKECGADQPLHIELSLQQY
jgi:hypothetical protein